MPKRLRAALRGALANRLAREIDEAFPMEEGAFCLATLHPTSEGAFLQVSSYIEPNGAKWRLQEEGRLAPTTEYMSHAAGLAAQKGMIPVFIHSHPQGPLDFSHTDNWAHAEWVPYFQANAGSAFASFIWHDGVAIGDLWVGEERREIDTVQVGLLPPRFHVRSATRRFPPERFSRQRKAWQDKRQSAIERSHVFVAGAGGTGSAMIEQLARMGVGSITVADPQKIEESNLNRTYGTIFKDAGKSWKVDVQVRHVAAFSGTRVTPHRKRVDDLDPSVLLAADIIVGTTDNQGSRAFLDEFARDHGTPYVDAGCRVTTDADGVSGLWVDVRQVLDGGPCLWCLGVLDADTVARDNLPEDVRKQAMQDEYVDRPDIQASLAPITTAAAAVAASKVAAFLVCDLGEPAFHLVQDIWRDQRFEPKTALCRHCRPEE